MFVQHAAGGVHETVSLKRSLHTARIHFNFSLSQLLAELYGPLITYANNDSWLKCGLQGQYIFLFVIPTSPNQIWDDN